MCDGAWFGQNVSEKPRRLLLYEYSAAMPFR